MYREIREEARGECTERSGRRLGVILGVRSGRRLGVSVQRDKGGG